MTKFRNDSFFIGVVLSLLVIFGTFGLGTLCHARNDTSAKLTSHPLISPVRIALGSGGNLLVSDSQVGMILTIDRQSLEVVRGFQVDGRPLGVGYCRGHIYVGNETKQCIEVFNPAGKNKSKGFGFDMTVVKPTDIATDQESGQVFVVDGAEKQVLVFSFKGEWMGQIPASGPDRDALANPTGITLDPVNKEVWVSDYGDDGYEIDPRVQVFDYKGFHLYTLKNTGELASTKMGLWEPEPTFSRPQGLVLNDNGKLFLVDCYSAEILVFSRDTGALIQTLGGYGSEPGMMRLPLDIVLDPDNDDLFVTNNRLARIEAFRGAGGDQ